MNREVHVRFWERAQVKFLRATRQNENRRFSGYVSFHRLRICSLSA
jgi:hypothetical protein